MKKRLFSLALALMLLTLAATPALAQNTGGLDLSGLESLALVGSGIPGISDWNPADPAGEMTETSPGIYTKVVAIQKNTPVSLKFAGNDQWTEEFTLGFSNIGSSQALGTPLELSNNANSGDLAFSFDLDCNLKFTVDLTGAVPTMVMEFTDEKPSYTVPEPVLHPTTVYVRVPEDWTDVRVWVWDDTGENPDEQGPWPGIFTMTQTTDGWYTADVPGEATNLLISANSGSMQTADIPLKADHDIWINAFYNPTDPIYTYYKIPIDCHHSHHNSQGFCIFCLEQVGHRYNSTFTCVCGAHATKLTNVYFKKSDAFSKVLILWSNSTETPNFPDGGIQMQRDENGIYFAQVPADTGYIFFSNGDGILRTLSFRHNSYSGYVYDDATGKWIAYDKAVTPTPPSTPPTPPTEPVNEPEEDDRRAHRADTGETIWLMVGIAVLLGAGITVLALPVKSKE